MKFQFLGANRQVTGSCHAVEVGGRRILVDCGLFQERPFLDRNWADFPIPPNSIDAVLLTHVHIDHSGLLPKLCRDGFDGPIYTTRASADLLEIMLRDCARIQEEDAKYKQKRHRKEKRTSKHPVIPLYVNDDVDRVLPLVEPVHYGGPTTICPNISATFHDAGHILGSAMIELNVEDGQKQKTVVFSGDIGQWNKPLVEDPTLLETADVVVMESTYGDKEHSFATPIDVQLERIVKETVKRGGNIVIPTFAVERAQELLFHISKLVHRDLIPDIPIFLDSPMAIDVTQIFRRHRPALDDEFWQRMDSGEPPLQFPGLKMCRSVEDSKEINQQKNSSIILSTSGMCTAGRIKHHLRQNIGRDDSTIVFVGFQGAGTLGRQIIDGKPEVRIHGQLRPVRAKIEQLFGCSAHADRSDLLKWLSGFHRAPEKVILVHGEESVSLAFAKTIEEKLHLTTVVPQFKQKLNA